jgi:H+-translocating NAD(P) transhydrogenase subunit alpha
VVDLGAEGGGNCELTHVGETVVENGVSIIGVRDAASAYPLDASAMFARNVVALLEHLTRDGELAPDWEDEIVAASCVTRDGEVLKQ